MFLFSSVAVDFGLHRVQNYNLFICKAEWPVIVRVPSANVSLVINQVSPDPLLGPMNIILVRKIEPGCAIIKVDEGITFSCDKYLGNFVNGCYLCNA